VSFSVIAFCALWLYAGWLFVEVSANNEPGPKRWSYPAWFGLIIIVLWPIMVPLSQRLLRIKQRKQQS